MAPVQPPRQPVGKPEDRQRGPERQQKPCRHQGACGVEQGKDEKPARIVRDRQQQQETHSGMTGPEDQASHEVGERDVGGRRNRPAVRDGIVGVRPQQRGEPQIDGHGPQHAARRRHQRRRRLAPAQCTVLQDHRLPHLLARAGEEQRHEHVVHQEVRCQDPPDVPYPLDPVVGAMREHPAIRVGPDEVVEPERVVDQEVVGMRIDVRPDQRDDRPRDQQDRITFDEIQDPIHAPASCRGSDVSGRYRMRQAGTMARSDHRAPERPGTHGTGHCDADLGSERTRHATPGDAQMTRPDADPRPILRTAPRSS